MKVCSEEGCTKKSETRGFCHAHYQQKRRSGSIKIAGGRTHASLEERIWRRVDKTETCWLWTGGKRGIGYGYIQEGGKGSKTLSVHRVVYEMLKEKIPDGLILLHSCDTPACVNPDHLMLGTHKENTQDMIQKGRKPYTGRSGEENHNSKVTSEQVIEIRRLYDNERKDIKWLAKEYGLSQRATRAIVLRENWKHV